jgi:hypothetical protein
MQSSTSCRMALDCEGFSMITYLRRLLNRRGSAESIEFLGIFIVILAAFYIFMMAYPPLMTKANVSAFTKTLTHQIEVNGAIDSEIESFAEELADVYNIDPIIDYDAPFIEGTNHIQIRDSFQVTVSVESKIVLFNSTIFDPVVVAVPIKDEKVGISEVLWK